MPLKIVPPVSPFRGLRGTDSWGSGVFGAFSGSTVSLNMEASGSKPGSSSGPPSCERCQRLRSRE